ncbi:MAG: hypothetical protein RIQ89_1462 [Bacteroidota bacterium]
MDLLNIHHKNLNILLASWLLLSAIMGITTIAKAGTSVELNADTIKNLKLDEIVVSGTMKAIHRSESPVPVEVYNQAFLKLNPSPNLFEALQTINGVRPQINCNLCNTGDIHINGLEGPYTMMLIDGMPIVSSLGSVYGLSGIPNGLIERIEIVKGPASALYGSEAVAGLINVITKKPTANGSLTIDQMVTSWGESNTDISWSKPISKQVKLLSGFNYFLYNNPKDANNDGYTDVTLQNRLSTFNKLQYYSGNGSNHQIAVRYLYEDRWGGQMIWDKKYRGGNEIYGENIYTNRYEILGQNQWSNKTNFHLSYSLIGHKQNSVYGNTDFNAKQHVYFIQTTWQKSIKRHELLLGSAIKYLSYYDDSSVNYLQNTNSNNSFNRSLLPGAFFQDEIKILDKHTVSFACRYDYHPTHKSIVTPRLALKIKTGPLSNIRFNTGSGFRVVNLFTEEHAALTGARSIILKDKLKPESSININLNYTKKIFIGIYSLLNLEISAFSTRFSNRIIPDYLTNPNQIIYGNLNGHAISQGLSINMEGTFDKLTMQLGATIMENNSIENGVKKRQLLTEHFSTTWTISYTLRKQSLNIDYSGNLYSPMLLPLAGTLDPRPNTSPWWSIQNIQLRYTKFKQLECYAGIKNLLNWTPAKGVPFLIARSHDPFDKQVNYNLDGSIASTPENPYALSFDPTYVYAPNQGARIFAGVRWSFSK